MRGTRHSFLHPWFAKLGFVWMASLRCHGKYVNVDSASYQTRYGRALFELTKHANLDCHNTARCICRRNLPLALASAVCEPFHLVIRFESLESALPLITSFFRRIVANVWTLDSYGSDFWRFGTMYSGWEILLQISIWRKLGLGWNFCLIM